MAEVTSPSSVVASSTLITRMVWLKNPLDASMNYHFYVENTWQDVDVVRPSSALYPLGDELAIVLSESVKGDTFGLTFLLLTDAAYDKMVAFIASSDTLLLQTPRRQWYVQITGNPKITEHMWSDDYEEGPARKVSLTFTQVEAP